MQRWLVLQVLFCLPLLCAVAVATAAENDSDPFAVGAIWVGDFRHAGANTPVNRWALKVTERKGQNMKATVIAEDMNKKKIEFTLEGKAPTKSAGEVNWKVLEGFSKGTFNGKLLKNEVGLVYKGVTNLGRPITGTASLEPKK